MIEPDDDPPRSEAPADDRLPPLARVVFYLPAYLIAQLMTGAVVIAGALSAHGTAETADLVTFEPGLPLLLGVGALFFPILLGGTWAFAHGLDRRPLRELGWRWPGGLGRTLVDALGALAGACGLLALWLVVGRAGFAAAWGGWAKLGGDGVPTTAGLGLVFGGFLLSAAGEELAFRGYVFHVLQERSSWASAAGLQAALFAALHASNPDISAAGLLNTFLLGLVLAAVAVITGSLCAPVLLHTGWNFLVALALPLSGLKSLGVAKLTVTGAAAWTGGAYGPEGSWVLSGLLALAVFALAPWADRARAARDEGSVANQAP